MNYPPGTEYSGDGVLYDSFGETSSEFGGNLESPNEVAVSSLPGDLDRQKRRERNRRQNRNRNRERFDRDRVDRPLICNESAVQGFLEGNYRDEEYGDYSCEIEQGYPDRRDSSYNNFGDRGNCDDRRGRNRGRRDRERNRDRDRNRGRDRDRERDRDRSRDRERDRDWREEIPNNTIMVRGLAPHISEADLRNEVTRYGLEPKDIRLMRKKYKDTGASRGFAFVEFLLLSEAVRWKELTQGVLIFGGDYRATLHYSIPKDGSGMKRNDASRADWSCSKCGLNNFRRRDVCFKCNTPREEAEEIRRQSGDGFEQISSTPSNALLLRNLDTLTTEERVLSVLGQLTSLPIKSIGIANDPLTNTSRGFCFVELHSISEASQLHDLLLSLDGQFYIDGRPVTITYARKSVNVIHSAASANAASVALAAAQWTNQVEPGSLPVNKNEQYQQGYDQYQADYNSSYQYNYGDLGGDNVGVARAEGDAHKSDGVKLKKGIQSSATISAGPRGVTASNVQANLGSVVVDGVSYAKYLPPDTSTYQYDDTSGYYYDPSTGLYYDANSQYYYNAEAQQFLYWDGEKQTYLPAPTQTPVAGGTDTESTKDEKSKNRDKQDKVKIAKKIAKDMERWAKTLNQKKENAKLGLSGIPTKSMLEQARQSAAADAGFAVLEKRNTIGERQALVSETLKKELEETKKFQMPLTGISKPTLKPNLVAAYGDGSDSDTEPEPLDVLQPVQNPLKAWEMKLTDLKKMACLLCKRQFPNKDALTRHQKLSDLHKQNMEALRRTIDTQEVVEKDERKPF